MRRDGQIGRRQKVLSRNFVVDETGNLGLNIWRDYLSYKQCCNAANLYRKLFRAKIEFIVNDTEVE
jgi:hypothetical protein